MLVCFQNSPHMQNTSINVAKNGPDVAKNKVETQNTENKDLFHVGQ